MPKPIEKMDAIWDAILGSTLGGPAAGARAMGLFLAIFGRTNIEHAVHLKGAADDGKRSQRWTFLQVSIKG